MQAGKTDINFINLFDRLLFTKIVLENLIYFYESRRDTFYD